MVTAKEIYNFLNSLMPFETQESWDNSGIAIDNSQTSADKIMVCLDISHNAIDKAIEENCGVMISHHPLIFSPLKSITDTSREYKLIKNNIGAVCAHTNYDKFKQGTCYNLWQFTGLKGKTEYQDIGLVLEIEEETDPLQLIKFLKENIGFTLSYTNGQKPVKRIFIISGGGKDMTEELLRLNCDCIITGESSYHDMFDLKYLGITTVCTCHDVSEKISVEPLAKLLADNFKDIQVITYTEENLTEFI